MGFAKPNSCKTALVFDMHKKSAVQWDGDLSFFRIDLYLHNQVDV